MHWRITGTVCRGLAANRGEYLVGLSRGIEAATATVQVAWTRELAAVDDGSFDPAVSVVACSSPSAHAWLEAPEHEYSIAELLRSRAA